MRAALLPLSLAAALAPVVIAGVQPLDAALEERWPLASAWVLPVGSPDAIGGGPGARPYRLLRGLQRSGDRLTHQGADIGNGEAGDTVRAAAPGLVIKTARDEPNGYGGHVVLAHREPDGGLLYTVYAHLMAGSIRVAAGDIVSAGEPLARVGRTGRASTPHLHFELRRPSDPSERWERTRVLDPLALILARLPVTRSDSSWARRYLDWGAHAGLVPHDIEPDAPLTRGRWWAMLAHASPGIWPGRMETPAALRDSLIARSVLPEDDASRRPDETPSWDDIVRDLERLDQLGSRLPPGPLARDAHRDACRAQLDHREPMRHGRSLSRRRDSLSVATACLLLADLAGAPADVVLESPRETKPVKKRKRTTSRRRARTPSP